MTAYIAGCLALIVKPGPDLMCTIATAIAHGKAEAAKFMCGLMLGCWLWILLLAAGAAAFFAGHPAVTKAIQFVGLAYISYLSAMAFREAAAGFRGDGAAGPAAPAKSGGSSCVWRGVAMAMSNPLTILFFLAFLPNFTAAGAPLPPALQTLALGTVFCLLVPFVYLPAIFAADFLRARLFGSARASAALKTCSAAILALVALALLARLAAPSQLS